MPATMLLRNLERVMELTDSERQTISEMPERTATLNGEKTL
jgi:hypothetical protein